MPTPCISDETLATMDQHTFTERPYLGLRDVYGNSLSERLKECLAENAWPDWVAYFAEASKSGMDIAMLGVLIDVAIELSGWPQTIADILDEVRCRNAGVFVVQAARGPLTVQAGQ